MEKEISSGAMLGIVLIALAAIIGIGFGVFAIAKGTANNGVTNVQEKLETVSQSDYNDYDQTIVTGTQVKSAYDNFVGKSSAVLIATQAMKDSIEKDSAKIKDKAAGVDKYTYKVSDSSTKTGSAAIPYVYAYADDGYSDGYSMTNSKGEDIKNPMFINYNALLASPNSPTDNSITVDETSKYPRVYFDTNGFVAVNGYQTKAGKVQFNYITGNLSKSGMIEFLPTSARFQSYLVKDASGTIMGVAFEQISSK